MKPSKKQAVVVIHGIGDQRPMSTIRSFVESVWSKDKASKGGLNNPRFWSKPSSVNGTLEQRRLTTNSPTFENEGQLTQVQRTDFYEYYWAHHTVNSSWSDVKGWFLSLAFRWPSEYQKHAPSLFPLWLVFWGLALASVVIFFCSDSGSSILKYIASGLTILFGGAVVSYLGDVARYITPSPANIESRQKIRLGGMALIDKLSQSGHYDRIVLVGHSLGSVIAYDILTQLWARDYKFKDENGKANPLSTKARKLADMLQQLSDEMFASQASDKESLKALALLQNDYRKCQSDLFEQLYYDNKNDNFPQQQWLISDFITLGSPLTHANFLLFKKPEDFILRKLDREFPTNPPLAECDGDTNSFIFTVNEESYLHHAAVFAPVRWSNLYSPVSDVLKGDIISGKVTEMFCPPGWTESKKQIVMSPIKELSVLNKELSSTERIFTHRKYWQQIKSSDDKHLKILRDELNLRRL